MTGQQGMSNLSSRTESRKRATCNLDLKREKKINMKQSKNYLSVEDNVLAKMVVDSKSSAKLSSTRISLSRKKSSVTSTPLPQNRSLFKLRKSFQYIKDENMSVTLFFNMSTDKLLNSKHPKLLYSRSTCFHLY